MMNVITIQAGWIIGGNHVPERTTFLGPLTVDILYASDRPDRFGRAYNLTDTFNSMRSECSALVCSLWVNADHGLGGTP